MARFLPTKRTLHKLEAIRTHNSRILELLVMLHKLEAIRTHNSRILELLVMPQRKALEPLRIVPIPLDSPHNMEEITVLICKELRV